MHENNYEFAIIKPKSTCEISHIQLRGLQKENVGKTKVDAIKNILKISAFENVQIHKLLNSIILMHSIRHIFNNCGRRVKGKKIHKSVHLHTHTNKKHWLSSPYALIHYHGPIVYRWMQTRWYDVVRLFVYVRCSLLPKKKLTRQITYRRTNQHHMQSFTRAFSIQKVFRAVAINFEVEFRPAFIFIARFLSASVCAIASLLFEN